MGFRGYREASKANRGTEESKGLTLTGAILRIADAAEKMAQRHTDLMRERDGWERRAKDAERALGEERRRTASLRGHLKRAKKMMSEVAPLRAALAEQQANQPGNMEDVYENTAGLAPAEMANMQAILNSARSSMLDRIAADDVASVAGSQGESKANVRPDQRSESDATAAHPAKSQ